MRASLLAVNLDEKVRKPPCTAWSISLNSRRPYRCAAAPLRQLCPKDTYEISRREEKEKRKKRAPTATGCHDHGQSEANAIKVNATTRREFGARVASRPAWAAPRRRPISTRPLQVPPVPAASNGGALSPSTARTGERHVQHRHPRLCVSRPVTDLLSVPQLTNIFPDISST